MNTISHHAALIYVMVVVSASDGAMSASELKTMGELVKTLPVFKDFEAQRLLPTSRGCAQILREPDGYSAILGLLKEALPPNLCETAYCLALEIALADRRIAIEEVRVIETLRRTLGIDKLVAAALERTMRARYQVA